MWVNFTVIFVDIYILHIYVLFWIYPRTQQQWQLKVYRDSRLKRSKIAWSSVVKWKKVMGPCTCNHHYCQPSGSSPCISQTKKHTKFAVLLQRNSSRFCWSLWIRNQLSTDLAKWNACCPFILHDFATFQRKSQHIITISNMYFYHLENFGRCPNLRFFTKDLQRETHTHTQLCGYFGLLLAGVPLFSGSKVHHPFAESAPKSLPPNSTPPARRMFFFNPTILR